MAKKSITRYFYTGNASRTYKKSGLVFTFDPLEFSGGSWSGTLAVENPEQAEVLASFGPPVKEVKEAEYTQLKKKLTTNLKPSSYEQPSEKQPEKQAAPPVVNDVSDELSFSKVGTDEDVLNA
jgi:hypothetical protein